MSASKVYYGDLRTSYDENLPGKLKQAAIAREEHPSSSLSELAGMMEPPITKPAMNHRLKKLVELSKETNV